MITEKVKKILLRKKFEDLKHFGVKSRHSYLKSTHEKLIVSSVNFQTFGDKIATKRQRAIDEIALLINASDYNQISNLTIKFK